MRKGLTALAVATAAFTAPMLGAGTAYAAVAPPVTIPLDAIEVAEIIDLAIPRGCTLTYVGMVGGTPIGPVVSAPPGSVTVNYDAAISYVWAQTSNTIWYIGCI